MQTLTEIREALAARGLSPKKSLGQNFLVDQNLGRKLLEAAALAPGELVLEIGPGTGTLTESLLESGREVIAAEMDDGLCELLKERFAPEIEAGRFRLAEGDCLKNKRALSPRITRRLDDRPFVLVANLPYGAATPVVLTLLADHPECRGMYVTIQREVADRLEAAPGSKAYGAISVVAQCVARVRRVANLPAECFWPRPGVASSMVAAERLERPLTADARGLADLCQRLFAGRRKQLGPLLKSLGHAEVPWPEGVEPTMRIEQLPPERIAALARACPGR